LSGSWDLYEMLSRLAILTSMMAFVPRSKRPRMAKSPRSWVVVAVCAGGVVVWAGGSIAGAVKWS
jgi:hypothetical protein